MPDDNWQDIPEWQALKKSLSYIPVAAVIVVIIVALALDLTFGGPSQPKLANSAPPPEVIRATVAAQPTSATPQAPTATATPMPAATVAPQSDIAFRDQTRVGDMMRIVSALQKYHQKNGNYPDTGGNIQTLCTYTDIDAGCKLKDFLDPLPEDPLGSAAKNGYWYSSDGKTFSVMAGMESGNYASPTKCDQSAIDHTGKKYLYCASPS